MDVFLKDISIPSLWVNEAFEKCLLYFLCIYSTVSTMLHKVVPEGMRDLRLISLQECCFCWPSHPSLLLSSTENFKLESCWEDLLQEEPDFGPPPPQFFMPLYFEMCKQLESN